MRPFSKLGYTGNPPVSLVWKQPRFGTDHYELVDHPTGDALYATLGWPKWLSDQAVARSAFGIWYFDRLGWARRTITATRLAKPAENIGMENRPAYERLASFEVGWFWEGDLTLSSGEIFHWYRTKSFRNAWALTEVLPLSHPQSAEMGKEGEPARNERKRKLFRLGRQPKPARRERLVYEIEFGMHWLKQEAWITLPAPQAVNAAELTFLLCLGMYLGYCFNQDSAAVAVTSSTAAVS
jgi:hypothetical protein